MRMRRNFILSFFINFAAFLNIIILGDTSSLELF